MEIMQRKYEINFWEWALGVQWGIMGNQQACAGQSQQPSERQPHPDSSKINAALHEDIERIASGTSVASDDNEAPIVNNSTAAASMEIHVLMDGPATTVVVSPTDGIQASLRRELDIRDTERITVVFGENIIGENDGDPHDDEDEATTWLDVGAEEGSTVSLQIEPAPAYGYMSPREAITTWAKEVDVTLKTLDNSEPSPSEYDALLKFLMVGGGETGKTQLMLRYTEGPAYTQQFVNHIGIDFRIKSVRFGGAAIKQQIWDTVRTHPSVPSIVQESLCPDSDLLQYHVRFPS